MSCRVFNTALEKAVTDLGTENKGTDKTIQILANADDTVLVGRTTGVLTEAIITFSVAAQEMGLKNRSAKNYSNKQSFDVS